MYLTMLYKFPGDVDLGADHGGSFLLAHAHSDEELAALLAAGWHKTTAEAKAAVPAPVLEVVNERAAIEAEKAQLEKEVAASEAELHRYRGKQSRKGSLL